jgi:type IV secretory pathway VirJ component
MSKLTIERWEEEGLHLLLDDGVGCLQSKSRRQIERAKEAIEFQEALEPYIQALNRADSELLAAVMAADGIRTTEASARRTDALNHMILAYTKLNTKDING